MATQDHTTDVAIAVLQLTRLIDPLMMMGDRATANEIRNRLQRIIDHRQLSRSVELVEAPSRPAGDDRAALLVAEALRLIDTVADSQPVHMLSIDRFGDGQGANRCRHCLALAPEVTSLWTDPAWHAPGCIWSGAVENRARRDALARQ